MYSPSPATATKRPFGLWLRLCGYSSQLPRSFTASGSRSPSTISWSGGTERTLTVWISLWRAHTILPLLSIDATGSSRPILNIKVPSSYPTATSLEPFSTASAQARSMPYCSVFSSRYVVACHSFSAPSSEPVMSRGSSGWKATAETLWAWPSRVCTHDLVW